MKILLTISLLLLFQLSFSQNRFLDLFNFSGKLESLLEPEMGKIKEEFKISDVSIGIMISIDWESNDGLECWSAKFWPLEENNLAFLLTMPIENGLSNTGTFLCEKDKILNVVKSTFLYKHINDSSSRIANIHFVKSKSFSIKAQKSFFSRCPQHLSNEIIEVADELVFITLTNERGTSRWVITPNKVILWHFRGTTPIGSPEISSITFNEEEFKEMVKRNDSNGILKMMIKDNTTYPYSTFNYNGESLE